MLSVLEVVSASKLPSLSLSYGLVFVPVKCLLQYLRRSLLFYIFCWTIKCIWIKFHERRAYKFIY